MAPAVEPPAPAPASAPAGSDPWEDEPWRGRPWTVYRGAAYDLAPFFATHPGGDWLLRLAVGRDCTALVESYHLRPAVVAARFARLPQLGPAFPLAAVPPSPRPNDSELYCAIRERVASELFGGARRDAHRDGGGPAIAAILGYALAAYVAYAALPCVATGAALGLGGAWIGLTVQHCANHGAMTPNAALNRLLGHTDDLIGGSALMWRYHHQVSHHVHCNDFGLDEDVFSAFPLLRFDARLPRRWFHRWQHVYMWALFPLLQLAFQAGDLKALATGETAGARTTGASLPERASVLLGKAAHFGLLLAPAAWAGWGATLGAACAYVATQGVVLAATFAVSHNVDEAKVAGETGGAAAERDWGRQQLTTSANWGGVVGNFFTGGLNLQVEHHLFPAICFVHYPAISAIVRQEAERRGVRYATYPSLPAILRRFVAYMAAVGVAEQAPMGPRPDLGRGVDSAPAGRRDPMPGQQGCPLRFVA